MFGSLKFRGFFAMFGRILKKGLLSVFLFVRFFIFISCFGMDLFGASEILGLGDSLVIPVPSSGASEEGDKCTEELGDKAEQAATGVDIASQIAVTQAVSDAAQATDEGGASFRIAHQGNAAINSTFSAAALKRYAECTAAISECESVCEEEIRGGCDGRYRGQEERINGCKKTAEETLARCRSQSAKCSQAGLQGLLAGINAATSLLAAKKLSGCQGEDCDEDSDETPPITRLAHLEDPEQAKGATHEGILFGEDMKGFGKDDFGNVDIPPPPPEGEVNKGSSSVAENADSNSDNFQGDIEEDPNSPYYSGGLSGLSSPSSGIRGRGLASRGFRKNADASGKGDKEESDPYKHERYPRDSSGSFIGGTASGSYNPSKGSRPYGRSGGKKLAFNSKKPFGKKGNLKRDIFKKAGAHVSIFEKMSRIIQSYCSQGTGKRCNY